MTRSLHLAKDLALPADAVTQTFAIFGKRGSGKTNGATVLVEELLAAHLPVVILDPVDAWWGLKASFNGKGPGFPIYVFGGAHGDLPLESTAGALIADVVAKERLPMILSMKLWGVAERARFVTDFAKRLLQVNTQPVMMVLEEADAFIPQRPAKGEEAMLGAMDRLVRWGRQSGIGCTIVTQRSAKVNKDVTTQAETLIAFRTTGPQDREAIDAWIKYHAGEDKRQEVLETLPTLPNGTAWVWSPEWLGVLQKVAVRRRATFDSAATPKVGQKTTQPKKLAEVDLEQLRTQMAETVEKAKADDPRELRKTIAELKREVTFIKTDLKPAKGQEVVYTDRPVLTDADRALLKELAQRLTARVDAIADRADVMLHSIAERAKDAVAATVNEWLGEVAAHRREFDRLLELKGFQKVLGKLATVIHTPLTPTAAVPRSPLARRVDPVLSTHRPARQVSASVVEGNGHVRLSKMQRAILTALAQHPDGLTKRQILVHTTYASSGPVSTAFADLLREGWVSASGYALTITIAGLTVLGPYDPLPVGDELRAWLLSGSKLSTMEKALLSVLCDAYPQAIRKGEVLDQAQYASSGPVSAAFAKLVAYHYAIPQGASILKAAEELFS